MTKKRVAVLISGSGTNLQALMDATLANDYPASIKLVMSNNPDAYGLGRAKKAGIDAMVINHRDFESREAFDAAMQEQLEQHDIEILCLAGFMRLLSDGFVSKWQGRMLNIHPSLLPEFKGAYAVHDALAAGAKKTGCTVHLVTSELDSGPTVMQASVPVLEGDSEEALHQRIHEQEHRIYPLALQKLCEDLSH